MPANAPPDDPLLDGGDIQGHILPGFRREQQLIVIYTVSDADRLRQALALLHPHVTTLEEVLPNRQARKAALISAQAPPKSQDLWLGLALGLHAVELLGTRDVIDLDDAFAAGQVPSRTGDPTGATLPDGRPNPAARPNWTFGGPSRRADLFLVFAHDGDIGAAAKPLLDRLSAALGTPPTFTEFCALLPGDIEHFGFRDGISQPGVRGSVLLGGQRVPLTSRYGVPSRDGVDYGKPGQPLLWPGRYLIGQPSSGTPGDTEPVALPEFRNGSFLVVRRLSQDVAAFYGDSEAMAQVLSAEIGRPLKGADLRARIVGRFPSGAALMRHDQEPTTPEAINALNHFEFANALEGVQLTDETATVVAPSFADPEPLRGLRCPIWAHIRKVNPRDLGTDKGGPAETRALQMLRRGIPFGPAFDHTNPAADVNRCERGLMFMSFQRRISEQFDKLNADWMNSFNGPQSGGFDLLVGQNVPQGHTLHAAKDAIYEPGGNGGAFTAPRQWVIPTGGAYLFAPSLAFIARHGTPANA